MRKSLGSLIYFPDFLITETNFKNIKSVYLFSLEIKLNETYKKFRKINLSVVLYV